MSVNVSFYMLIPVATITQDQIDNSTSEVASDMAKLGTDYIVEVEEPQLIGTAFYAGLRRYTKIQMHVVIRNG